MTGSAVPGDAEALIEQLRRAREILDAHLRVGDILTHATALGFVQEHVFTGRAGIWLCGTPTQETTRLARLAAHPIDEPAQRISPIEVTHVNRIPMESVPTWLRTLYPAPMPPTSP